MNVGGRWEEEGDRRKEDIDRKNEDKAGVGTKMKEKKREERGK
jgi:hypothetical protein